MNKTEVIAELEYVKDMFDASPRVIEACDTAIDAIMNKEHRSRQIPPIEDLYLKDLTVGSRIKFVRQFRRMTQRELREACGFGNSQSSCISGYENQKRIPKKEQILKFADVLQVNPLALVRMDMQRADDIHAVLFEIKMWQEECRGKTYPAIDFKGTSYAVYDQELSKQRDLYQSGEITKEEYLNWKLSWQPGSGDNK